MKLTIINSNSAGNCYILQNAKEALIIECGVRADLIKKALKFNMAKVVGCLVSHAHLDHCKGVLSLMQAGIRIYATHGTLMEMNIEVFNHRKKVITERIPFVIGGFRIVAFDVKHDAAQPVGFLIDHKETGTVLFLTDTVYSPYVFKGLNNVIIESNYCEEILEQKLNNGTGKFLRDRVIESHLSIQNCKELLKANDLSRVNNIVLIHLSDNHSDAARFEKEVHELTGKNVFVADAGMEIEFNKTAF